MKLKGILAYILFLLSISFTVDAQTGFYDEETIQLIEITFLQPNWDYMLDTAKAGSDGYIMASLVKINGTEFDSVGVKYKGNSTYRPNQIKNPFHIELDTYKDQNYQGFTDIKLSNVFNDPSFLREVLSYKIIRSYMDAPQSNYANVYVNNDLIGLYTNSESIGKKFVGAHFGSKTNSFFKCNPIDGAGPGGDDYPNLVYLGTDSSLYYNRYELKSDYGWDDLVNLCDTLANHTTVIEKTMNINQALWMLAFNNLLVNLDSYSGAFAQNYYLYKDDYSCFQPVVWDMNESFGRFSNTGTFNLPNTVSKQQMTHLLHSGDAGWPLIKNLLANPMYRRMYIAQMRTILSEHFANNSYYDEGLALQSLIGASVSADPNKFYSYAGFLSNLTTDVNGGNGSAPGLTNLMNGRNSYLSGLADFTAVQPVISGIGVSVDLPFIGSLVNITANVTNASVDGVFLLYRNAEYAPFQRIQMNDDGLHGDGNANDGIYGATIRVGSGKTGYYLYAENTQAGIFSPPHADKDFYTFFAQSTGTGKLSINEFLASNSTTMPDQDGEFDDWIEIYNHSADIVSLDSTYLSDSYSNLQKWKFPDNIVIQPNSFLIVWADEDITQTGLHTNYKLSASGEELVLSDFSNGIIDSISFGVQATDISMQRCPDATGNFVSETPTYYAPNICTTSVPDIPSEDELLIYPVPFNDRLNIKSGSMPICNIRIINLTGQTLADVKYNASTHIELNLSSLSEGFFILIINNTISRKIIRNQ
ncbi:MAG: CotH kinase family protein [Bacteroidota bacterium]